MALFQWRLLFPMYVGDLNIQTQSLKQDTWRGFRNGWKRNTPQILALPEPSMCFCVLKIAMHCAVATWMKAETIFWIKGPRKALDDFHFITPLGNGSVVHMNQSNSTLQLQVDIFAMDMANDVNAWANSVAKDVEIQGRMKALLVIHDSSKGIRF